MKPAQKAAGADSKKTIRMCAATTCIRRSPSAGTSRRRCCPTVASSTRSFRIPYDGSDKRTLIVDPANPEEMRAVKQLHLIPDIKNDPGMGVYVIDADLLNVKKKES